MYISWGGIPFQELSVEGILRLSEKWLGIENMSRLCVFSRGMLKKKPHHGGSFNRKKVIFINLYSVGGGILLRDCVVSEIWVATSLALISVMWKGLSF